jgi:hypothetical protein
MSFRKRGEVVPGRGTVPHNPMLNRTTGIASTSTNRMLRQQTGEISTRSGISQACIYIRDYINKICLNSILASS